MARYRRTSHAQAYADFELSFPFGRSSLVPFVGDHYLRAFVGSLSPLVACLCLLLRGNYVCGDDIFVLVVVARNPAFSAKDKSLVTAGVLLKMVGAARELGDSDWALELHVAASRGSGVTRQMWQDVVRVLTKAGRLEEAARVLQVKRQKHLICFCFVLLFFSFPLRCFLKWRTGLSLCPRGLEPNPTKALTSFVAPALTTRTHTPACSIPVVGFPGLTRRSIGQLVALCPRDRSVSTKTLRLPIMEV